MKYPVYRPLLDGNEKKYVLDCLESTWISSKGEYLARFERDFADYLGTKYATAVCNGTAALHTALLALGIGPGDRVIVPTLTYVASVNAIAYTGATPDFVDSLPTTWQLDPAEVEAKITRQTKAVLAVHLYGHPCALHALQEVVPAHGLYLVEDCAEAMGTEYRGAKVGTFGDVACFSFFGNKTITTGEGGMVVTNDTKLDAAARCVKGQGLAANREYWHEIIGYNYRMTNICAAIGCAQLERIHTLIERKIALAERYRVALADLPVTFHQPVGEGLHTYWMNSLLTHDAAHRDPLRQHLARSGVETRSLFTPVHLMPPYVADPPAVFPVAEDLAVRGMNLPSYPQLSNADVGYITDSIRTYFAAAGIRRQTRVHETSPRPGWRQADRPGADRRQQVPGRGMSRRGCVTNGSTVMADDHEGRSLRIGISTRDFHLSGAVDLLRLIMRGLVLRREHELFLLMEYDSEPDAGRSASEQFSRSQETAPPGPCGSRRMARVERAIGWLRLRRLYTRLRRQALLRRRAEAVYGAAVRQTTVVAVSRAEGSLERAAAMYQLDVVLPMLSVLTVPFVGYLYDCQHKYYPGYFAPGEPALRDKGFRMLLGGSHALIVNSRDARNDLMKFFDADPQVVFALPCAPLVGPDALRHRPELLQPYRLPPRYFLVSNQFWVHKSLETALRTSPPVGRRDGGLPDRVYRSDGGAAVSRVHQGVHAGSQGHAPRGEHAISRLHPQARSAGDHEACRGRDPAHAFRRWPGGRVGLRREGAGGALHRVGHSGQS